MKKIRKSIETVGITLLILLTILPFILVVLLSFLPEEQLLQLKGGGFTGMMTVVRSLLFEGIRTGDQYKNVLAASPDYLFRFWNSVKLAFPSAVLQLVLTGLFSYALMYIKEKLYRGILFLAMVLMLLPQQITALSGYYTLKALHLLDTNTGLMLSGVFSPFGIYLLAKTMKRIPREVVEAARTDGAGYFSVLTKIVLPQCRGQLTTLFLLFLIDSWNQVEQPLLLISDPFKYPLSVYLSKIHEEALGISFASSVIYMIPMVLIFLYAAEDMKEGLGKLV
ncbi:MAG: carbohydrate ABC transporter permease [Lachnospiraceae bacterium]|nr:carbohydrate ABC transporter permease [Lachnospiraceae bacterium]